MASDSWLAWANWSTSIEHTLEEAQLKVAGDQPVAEVRVKAGDRGLGNVLDVYSLVKQPDPRGCWVLSPAELHQHFGSKMPSKKAIEGGIEGFLGKMRSGESIAVTAYLRGMPCAVLFAGKRAR